MKNERRTLIGSAMLFLCGVWIADAASAQSVPDYDFQWSTVTEVGNAPYPGPDPTGWNYLVGRGSVGYEYRISQFEVTTAQWMEFVNTFSTQSAGLANFAQPTFWGAVTDTSYQGPGRRYRLNPGLPQAAMLPVMGAGWRAAAMYCNWLHNNKATDFSSTQNGAYDASTFSGGGGRPFSDQRTRSPGARFWIPSIDEWMKSVHFDPDRYGTDQPGWWQYTNGSDTPLTPGPPGVGQTTGGWFDDFFAHLFVPLGAYPDVRTPWGLYDASGGTSEWTEEIVDVFTSRLTDGSWAGMSFDLDPAWSAFGTPPDRGGTDGLRIASSVPSTSSLFGFVFGMSLVQHWQRRRR